MEGIIKRTRAQWIAGNFVLKLHEQGQETDTNLAKSGDGATAWNNLPYENGIPKMTDTERATYSPTGKTVYCMDTVTETYYKWNAVANEWGPF